jgi:hypothetical protein
VALAAVALVAACGTNNTAPPSTVTVTSEPRVAAPASTTEPPAGPITIPDVAGQNAEIVRNKLEKKGLTDVNLLSANPKYTVVVLASNWTVVSIEPAPGTSSRLATRSSSR